ncbi:MAG: hypothetical protein M3Z13_05725, partial [Candidatus Dormibacteraeota bacterium]|nr:hypothetical protein [Candidatus Dormibacteraeota bacterium]
LLVVQLIPDHRSAAAMSGLLVTILFLENGVARSAAWLAPAASVSPFHYYDLSRPVDPGGAVNPAAIAVLLATAAGFALLALMAFTRRDIGRSVLDRAARDGNAPQRSGATAGASPWLRVPVLADVYETRAGLVAWIAAAVLLTAFMTSIARTITQVIRGTPGLDAYRSALNDKGDITVAVMSLVVLGLAQAVVIVFAIAQVSRWANQDADGRLELILSQPTSRSRVVLIRGAGLVLGLCLISAAIVSTLATAALTQHAAIGLAGALEAAALLMALGLAFGGVGAMLIGRQPRLAVTILGIYAGLAYIIQQFGPLARWPSWVLGISVLRLGGQPLAGHVDWAELGAMAALAGAGFGAAIITMQRREVGR